jgi:hypothetical protein
MILLTVFSYASATPLELHPMPALTNIPSTPPLGEIIAVDFHPEGGFVLLESGNQRLLQFDRDGRFVGEAGGFGFREGSLRGASDITRAGFEIWVADPLAGKIVRFDNRLAPLEPWTGALERGVEAPFTRPVSAARAVSGDAVVIEHDRSEAWLLDPDGRLVERIGSYGEMERSFSDPKRVEISQSGTIAVADPGQQAVFLFDRFGTPRGYRPWKNAGPGPTTVAWLNDRMFAAGPDRLRLLNPRGQTVQEWDGDLFGGPIHDLACDGNHLLIAVGNTVQRFRLSSSEEEE